MCLVLTITNIPISGLGVEGVIRVDTEASAEDDGVIGKFRDVVANSTLFSRDETAFEVR